jgi:hypothetical protein
VGFVFIVYIDFCLKKAGVKKKKKKKLGIKGM